MMPGIIKHKDGMMTTEHANHGNGGPMIDPTRNVLDLVEASVARQDDLRVSSDKRLDSELRHLNDMMILRADHAREIGALESNRLNAIRQVDVLAVSTAADRAQAAIQTLAASTATNAETLRNMVANTAQTMATQLNSTVMAITERLAALEKSSYKGEGRLAYSDPAIAELMSEMKGLVSSRALYSGKSAGSQAMWGYVVGGIGLLFTLVSLAAVLIKFF